MKTEEIVKKQTKYIVPGTVKGRYPVAIVEAKGAVIKDVEGKEYIDCHGGYAAVNVGHCHPRVVKALQEQAAKVWHVSWDFYLLPTTQLAERLAEICPGGLRRVFFASSGAEAVENAVKFAKKYVYTRQGRGGSQVISLMGSFHGRTAYAMALTGQEKYKVGLSTYVHPGVVHVPPPYCYRCFFKLTYPDCDLYCAKYLEQVFKFKTAGGDVAAFISEPIMGEGGIIVPPEGYLKEAVEIVREHEALYIADEIQTGFGRTGKLFGVEWYGVEPEIMTLAKGIASGVPLAAVTVTEEIAEVLTPIDHCSTYGGNALACAAAVANIDVLLEERLTEKALRMGEKIMRGLEDLAEKYPLVGEVRGKGLMIGVELVKDRESKKPAAEEAERIRLEAMKRGLLINTGGVFGCVLRFQPPLLITEEQVERALEILDDSFRVVTP